MDTTTIGGRVWAVREKFRLSRKDFADRVGSTADEIGNVEYNRLKKPELKEPLYRAISSEFGVSIDWIKNGNGDMFGSDDRDAIAQAYGELAARKNPVIDGAIQFMRTRSDAEMDMILNSLQELLDFIHKTKEQEK